MGKRTLVHVTKKITGTYRWTGKIAECCVMAVHSNGYVTNERLHDYVFDKVITEEEYKAIRRFDIDNGTQNDLETISELAKRLKLKIVIHETPKLEQVK